MLTAHRFFAALLILATLPSLVVASEETPKLDLEIGQCLSQNVLAFGASITQAINSKMPGYRLFVSGVEAYSDYEKNPESLMGHSWISKKYFARAFGKSPAQYLVTSMVGAKAAANIHYTGISFTSHFQDLGSQQVKSMFEGARKRQYDDSTMVVGVDGFYWDAIWNTCRGDIGDGTGPEAMIEKLILEGKRRGKTTILGNVPLENSANVRIASVRTGVKGLWYQPNVECSQSINATLERFCTVENNCYLLDLKSAIDDLNCGMQLKGVDGKNYLYHDIRPDGVHLSTIGSKIVARRMYDALASHPPQCEVRHRNH